MMYVDKFAFILIVLTIKKNQNKNYQNIPIKNIVYLTGAAMFVYVYFCRFFQMNKGYLSIFGLIFAIIYTITDIIQLLFDTINHSMIHDISATILFISVAIYQIIHLILTTQTIKNVQKTMSICQILMKCEVLYLIFITMITISAETMFFLNILAFDNDQFLVEWIAVIGINAYFWGFISFFIQDIYDLIDDNKKSPTVRRYESGMVDYNATIHNV